MCIRDSYEVAKRRVSFAGGAAVITDVNVEDFNALTGAPLEETVGRFVARRRASTALGVVLGAALAAAVGVLLGDRMALGIGLALGALVGGIAGRSLARSRALK